MRPTRSLPTLLSAAAWSALIVGCGHTISESKKTTVNSNGTMTSKETTVTQNADGTVTKKEETKRTSR